MTCKILKKLQELCQECEHNQSVEETVWQKDPKTGLEWGPISPESMTWEKAKNWAKKQGGRLPTRLELFTFFEIGVKEIINPMGNKLFWSSSSVVGYADSAWGVDFNYGNVDYGNKGNNYYARCVRP
jgi:hypothetical protein